MMKQSISSQPLRSSEDYLIAMYSDRETHAEEALMAHANLMAHFHIGSRRCPPLRTPTVQIMSSWYHNHVNVNVCVRVCVCERERQRTLQVSVEQQD